MIFRIGELRIQKGLCIASTGTTESLSDVAEIPGDGKDRNTGIYSGEFVNRILERNTATVITESNQFERHLIVLQVNRLELSGGVEIGENHVCTAFKVAIADYVVTISKIEYQVRSDGYLVIAQHVTEYNLSQTESSKRCGHLTAVVRDIWCKLQFVALGLKLAITSHIVFWLENLFLLNRLSTVFEGRSKLVVTKINLTGSRGFSSFFFFSLCPGCRNL